MMRLKERTNDDYKCEWVCTIYFVKKQINHKKPVKCKKKENKTFNFFVNNNNNIKLFEIQKVEKKNLKGNIEWAWKYNKQ